MSRSEEFNQGRQQESVIDAPHIHGILPNAEVRFWRGEEGGRNHRLSVATPGKEFIPGAGKVGGIQHGSMSWNAGTGRIEGILTEQPKRKGVATAMFHTARELAAQHGIAPPVHSETKTPEGAAWAAKVQ